MKIIKSPILSRYDRDWIFYDDVGFHMYICHERLKEYIDSRVKQLRIVISDKSFPNSKEFTIIKNNPNYRSIRIKGEDDYIYIYAAFKYDLDQLVTGESTQLWLGAEIL